MNLSLSAVTKDYDTTRAVDTVTLETLAGVGVLVLIGPSGGGKSTLLRLIGGLEPPTSGQITWDGEPLGSGEQELRNFRLRNGFLFQNFNLFPHLSAIQNVTLPLEKVHGQDQDQARSRAEKVLTHFGLQKHAEKMPTQLSGGQQQRVGLARAMAHEPKLLLLDEPTSALDPEMKAEVLDVIDTLRQDGQRIILTTHEMGFAKRAGDQVAFLAEGQLLGTDQASAFFDHPPTPEIEQFLSRVMKW